MERTRGSDQVPAQQFKKAARDDAVNMPATNARSGEHLLAGSGSPNARGLLEQLLLCHYEPPKKNSGKAERGEKWPKGVRGIR